MPDIPESLIKTMNYQTRLDNFHQELSETLQKMGRLPLWEYDKVIKKLTKKWRV